MWLGEHTAQKQEHETQLEINLRVQKLKTLG